MTLEALHEDVKPLGLKVSWPKTNVLDETIQSVHVFGENIEILKNFTYLGSVLHNDGAPSQKLTRRTELWIRSTRVLALSISVQTDKDLDLQLAGDPCLLSGYETWTLNTDLRRRIDVFGIRLIRRMMGYH